MPVSAVDQFFLARSVEHLVVALIGVAVVWMGYRLFREMPLRREGETKIAAGRYLDLPVPCRPRHFLRVIRHRPHRLYGDSTGDLSARQWHG